jgi:hypothetical protein
LENESRHSRRHTVATPAKAGVKAGVSLAEKEMVQQLRRVMTVQAVLHEPFSMANSLLTGKITGIFAELPHGKRIGMRWNRAFRHFQGRNPSN